MALHHETDGGELGYDIWCEHSKRSEKFDIVDQERVWRSFKKRTLLPFRMASLVAVVKDIRLEREFEDLGEDDLSGDEDFLNLDDTADMFADLLGGGEQAAPKKKRATPNLS